MTVPAIRVQGLAPRLRQLRLELGWTLDQVAQVTGASGRQVVGHWETGKRTPELRSLLLLSLWYGCSLDYLFGFTKERDSPAVRAVKRALPLDLRRAPLPDAPSDRFRLVFRLAQTLDPEAFFAQRVAAYLLLAPDTLDAFSRQGSVPAEVIQRFAVLVELPLAWFYSASA